MTAGVGASQALAWASALALSGGPAVRAVRRRDGVRRRARRLAGGVEPVPAGTRPYGAAQALAHLRSAGRERWQGRWWSRPEALCLPVGVALAVLTRSAVPLPLPVAVAAVPVTGRAVRRRAERAAAVRRSAAVSTLCGAVAGDLRAGRPPHGALADAVEAAGWLRSADLAETGRLLLSAARFGGDVPHALRTASRVAEGAQGLAAVAACWQVAVDGGAGLAAALDQVAAALRAESDRRDDLSAHLAGPRSTAVLLALLPLFGLLLGAGVGADPSAILLHTPAGLLCLLAGVLLEWAGLAWTARIIRAAESGRGRPPAAARQVRKGSFAGAPGRRPS